jgi:hypothetical protein
MSNAGKNQKPSGDKPQKKPRAAAPSNLAPMGAAFSRPAKDDMRSRIIKLTERYRSVCDESDSHRFRVRAEVLFSGEEYFTVDFGCSINGLIDVPWKEYPSTELEIQFGRKIERAQHILTAVRRAPDRIGRAISVSHALSMEKSGVFQILLKSSKDYKSISQETRDAYKGVVAPAQPPPLPKKSEAALAKALMEETFHNPDHRSWAEESQDLHDHTTGQGVNITPTTGTSGSDNNGVSRPPIPGGFPPDPNRSVPPVNNRGDGGQRSVPPPSSSGPSRSVPPPTTL